jgi:Uma2 family endonuclease
MTLDEFTEADFEAGWLYELARGVVIATEVPGISHGRSVRGFAKLFLLYDEAYPGVINYSAGGGECRLRLPEMQSDRHPDQAVYLLPPPAGPRPWTRWVPEIVVEVLSEGSEERDLVEKREEYLRAGVTEYWILNPFGRCLVVLQRAGDAWQELVIPAGGCYHPHLLPGLEVRPADLLGPDPAE